MLEQHALMGLLYIFGAVFLLIMAWVVVDRLRLGRLRIDRQKKGIGRDQFIEAFLQNGIPDEISAAVFDYYSSQKPWRDFPFSPDDKYSDVLHDDPLDLEDDARALVERLGLAFPPDYVLKDREDQPIKTLRDMVLWLDWVRQRQQTAI